MSDDLGFDSHDFDVPLPRVLQSLVHRIGLSILALSGWLSFVLLYLGFWMHGFSTVQSVVLLAVSILFLFAFLAMIWVSFGFVESRRGLDG